MTFHSILFETPQDGPKRDDAMEPDFFGDLNLDQIVSAVTLGRHDYKLKPFFYTELSREEAIAYRHEVIQDLDNADVLESIKAFAQGIRKVRAHLAQAEKLYYRLQKTWWFMEDASEFRSRVAGGLAAVERAAWIPALSGQVRRIGALPVADS